MEWSDDGPSVPSGGFAHLTFWLYNCARCSRFVMMFVFDFWREISTAMSCFCVKTKAHKAVFKTKGEEKW